MHMRRVKPKVLYKLYQIPVVKPGLHFTSPKLYNINLSLNSIPNTQNSLNSLYVNPYSPCQKIVNRTTQPIIRSHRTQGLNSSTARQTELPHVTNSQAAAHESWLVRCSPCAPGLAVSNLFQFPSCCKNQLTALAHNLGSRSPIIFTGQFRGNKGEYIWLLRESNQGFRGGSSTSQSPCYILMLCYRFHRFFYSTTTVQD